LSTKNGDLITVLHVDDDSSILETVKLILIDMDNNIIVDPATSVDEAFEILKKKHYDVIISDFEMPIKNGLAFLKELREKNDTTPFILFTGKGKEEVAIQALNLGADHYLNKLGDPEAVYKELIQSIHQLHKKVNLKSLLKENKGLVIENMPDAIILSDFEGNFLDGNRRLQELIGYKKEELFGKNIQKMQIMSNETLSAVMKQIVEVSLGKTVDSSEYIFNNKEGKTIFIELSVFPAKRDEETIIMFVIRDITKRKKIEEELQQKMEILENVMKSTDSGLGVISKDYDVLWANSTLQPPIQKYGGPNKKCYQIFNNLNSVCPDCGIKKVFEKNVPLAVREYDFRIEENGPTEWVELRSTPLKDKNGVVVAGLEVAVPITQRKKIQQALLESEERYRMIAHNMQDVVFLINLKTIISYVSPSISAFGYSPEELIGKSHFSLIHPADLDRIRESCMPKLSKYEDISPFELRILTKDKKYVWIECSVKAIKNAAGENKFVIISRNIETRKKAEDQVAIVNEKLQLLGKLTRHDVRNKLTVITSNAYLLKKKCENDPESLKYIKGIEEAVFLSSRIFEFSKVYEKIGAEKQTDIDIRKCFDEATTLFQNSTTVKIINQTGGLIVFADSLLRQLFYNLIDNSLKHGKKVTQITLHFRNEEEKIKLFYEDDGIGISAENKTKLFTEGFSTSNGTGLGLAMIKKMMEVYNWQIRETGVPGQGVKFEITIPKTK